MLTFGGFSLEMSEYAVRLARLQTTEMSTLPSLENPRHTGYLTDDVSDGEAGRDYDNRRHTEFE